MKAEITALYLGELGKLVGQDQEEVPASSVRQVLNFLRRRHGREVYRMAKSMHIVVNGENVTLKNGLSTRLTTGDRVTFLPITGGG